MSEIDRHKVACATQDVNRAMSMLGLVQSALRLEESFQDEHVNRPIVVSDHFIPTLGEVVDTVAACHELLNRCWGDLTRKEDRI